MKIRIFILLLVAAALLLHAVSVLAGKVIMTGRSLQEYPDALCLDGTPGMYFHSPGVGDGANKWYIELQGGGWCGGVDDCIKRSKTFLGSSSEWPAMRRRLTPFFDDDPLENPLMHDWNKIYLGYCDGFSFSGNVSEPVEHNGTILHVRGHGIFMAAVYDWLVQRNLSAATHVLLGGNSAGGLSTILKCDRVAERIQEHSPGVKFGCAPESGFFMNYNGTSGLATYGDLMVDGVSFHRPILPPRCVKHEPQADFSACVFAERVTKYMKTPIFVMQSIYDSWARGVIRLSNSDPDEINRFGDTVSSTILESVLTDAESRDQNGVYLDSCVRHNNGYHVEISGTTKVEALKLWYERNVQQTLVDKEDIYVQGAKYLCEACCGTTIVSSAVKTSASPSITASSMPSLPPSAALSHATSDLWIVSPSNAPSLSPSKFPSVTSASPSITLSSMPSLPPSAAPSHATSDLWSVSPSNVPSLSPSEFSSVAPSHSTGASRPGLVAAVVRTSSAGNGAYCWRHSGSFSAFMGILAIGLLCY